MFVEQLQRPMAGVVVRRVAYADSASAFASAPPTVHTAARLPAALRARIGWGLSPAA